MARYKFKRRSSNYLDNRKQKDRTITRLVNFTNLTFGTIGVVFKQDGLVELRHVVYIRRLLKRFYVKKKKRLIRKMRMKRKKRKKSKAAEKIAKKIRKLQKKHKKTKIKRAKCRLTWKKRCWFYLFPTVIVSRKTKNSRMGKGKGNIRKWRIRVRAKLIFLRFVGYKFSALHHIFFKKVEKKMPVPVHIFTTLFKRFSSRITRHTRLQYVLRKHF